MVARIHPHINTHELIVCFGSSPANLPSRLPLFSLAFRNLRRSFHVLQCTANTNREQKRRFFVIRQSATSRVGEETAWGCYCCSSLDSLSATTLPLCLSHSLSSSSSSSTTSSSSSPPHPLHTPVPTPKRRAPPALRSPRPDPGTIQNRESLNNASAADALKGAREQFSASNNAASTVTMETNDGPLEGGGVGGEKGRWGGELSEGGKEGRVDEWKMGEVCVCVSNRACSFCECVSGYECTGRYFEGAIRGIHYQRWCTTEVECSFLTIILTIACFNDPHF